MAIYTPINNTQIAHPDIQNADRDLLLRSFLQGQQGAGAAAENAMSQNQSANLAEKAKQSDLQRAIDAQGDLGSGTVSSGTAKVETNPASVMMAQQKQAAAEASKLKSLYGKPQADIEASAGLISSGLDGINAGTPQGDKTAIASLTRLADGKGARMTMAQLSSMTPHSASGSAQDMMNYWSGQADSGLSPQQRGALQGLLNVHNQRLQKEYGDTLDEFKQQAPFMAPSLKNSGQLDALVESYGQKGKSMFENNSKLGQQKVNAHAPAPDTGRGFLQQMGGGLASLLGMGGDSQDSGPKMPNPQPTAPSGPGPGTVNQGMPQAQQASMPQGPSPASQGNGMPPVSDIQKEIMRRQQMKKQGLGQ